MSITAAPAPAYKAWLPSRQTLPLLVTLLVCGLMYGAASYHYDNFFTPQVAINLVGDNAFLGIAAIGMTFVILSGGIDLSVGSAIGCTAVFIAAMVENHGWHPAVAIAVVLVAGTVIGTLHGLLIHTFKLQPFLVTLGGLFFYRGAGLLVSRESISLTHPTYEWLSGYTFNLPGGNSLTIAPIIFIALVVFAIWLAACRPAGRAVYAIGGSEQSALLMGLPVGRVKVGVYGFSGFCAALAGVTSTIMMSSGNAITGAGLELDAIAAVVIGGTLLSGGVGGPFGTLLGVLIFGIIQTAITFQGDLSSWWARIVLGLL
ncbi:MAG: sugar transporter permease YjfF, partial [Phycisphaerales bacterium]|nr:sugar transporter permease YjfF [Phycisphaerales bacterium]